MTPLELTLDTLARSQNDAATPVLLAALESTDRRVFESAVIAGARRRGKKTHIAILERWHQLSPELRRAVEQKNDGRMGGALHDALLSPDDQMFFNACDVAKASGEFDLVPTLISVAEQADERRSGIATELVRGLIDRLMHSEEDGGEGGYSRHPETIRRSVLESLERSIERFALHGRRALVEGFVELAGPDDLSLRTILDSPLHPCYQTISETLELSVSDGLVGLLTAYLVGYEAPLAVRNVVARRTDGTFVAALLSMPIDATNAVLAKNMGRIKSLACLASAEAACRRLPPPAQAAAMRLVALCGAGEEAKLDFAAVLLAQGADVARIAACESLQRISGQHSNELVLAALDDDNGDVQAVATRQLRDRHIPGTMARLIELVASPHPQVQAAARESLAEFSFENFLARYEVMDDDARRSTGEVVTKVDLTAIDGLKQELSSLVRRRRLRAIEVAAAMGVTARVADALLDLLQDEDHMVRAAAVSALADCSPMDVRDALLEALGDRSHAVQSAARDSLRALGFEASVAGANAKREEYR
jgi:HEAT repeat protein